MQAATMPAGQRDRDAEIADAIEWVTGGVGPVRVHSTTDHRDVTSRLTFTESCDAVGSVWAPFTGALGQLSTDGNQLRVGVGDLSDPGRAVEQVRTAAASCGRMLTADSVVRVEFSTLSARLVSAAADGLASGYGGTGPVDLVVPPEHIAAVRSGLLWSAAGRLSSLLVSAPANVLTPARAASWAEEIADRSGMAYTVLNPNELAAEGFGALIAIGSGSAEGSRLVQLSRPAAPGAPTVALVGKGITFDSGGLSLKSAEQMQSMRLDMAGAATILATVAALPHLDPDVGITAVLPFAENLVGPGAVRPGDVVRAWNGTEIQVLDTDFEGRVVLADALALAGSTRPDFLVDLATLTYQAEIALGPEIAAVIGRDDRAVMPWLDAAAIAGEPMWQLPWAERYLDQVRTPWGVRNHPLHPSGRALTAALFLGEFVPTDIPWVHCDMSGPSWRGDASVDGATGFGVRTVLAFLDNLPRLREGNRS